ncbi:MAG: TolC family protein [Gemmatimonadetes bacterium]|nr:TolC family protein [Gemmatimonadota bacterium]
MRKRLAVIAVLALIVPSATAAQEAATSQTSAFWRMVEDTLLERLIDRAIEANRDLRAVEARVREARATRGEARLDLLPVVTASGGYSRQRLAAAAFPGASGTLPDQDVWDAGLQLSWEVDVFGRLRRNLAGRNALLASAEEDVRDVQALLAAEVAGAYFDLRGAQERLAVAERNAGNQRNTLVLTQDRLELGRGNALDTERARAQLSSTLATVPAIEAGIAALRHRIGVLLGQPPASLIPELESDYCRPALPAGLRVANLDAIVRDRPDVRSAERQFAASRAFVGSAKADYLPRLSIGGVAGYTADAFSGLGNSGTPRYAIGPVLSWPLFDLGRVKTRVEAARAVESEASARLEQSVLLALEEAETAMTSYERSRERLTHLEEAAAASERATALARARFEGGVTDFLEVLDAERRQLEAQDRLAAGRAEASARLVGVYRALRGRWPAQDAR